MISKVLISILTGLIMYFAMKFAGHVEKNYFTELSSNRLDVLLCSTALIIVAGAIVIFYEIITLAMQIL